MKNFREKTIKMFKRYYYSLDNSREVEIFIALHWKDYKIWSVIESKK